MKNVKYPTGAGASFEDGNGATKLAAVDAELDAIAALLADDKWAEAGRRAGPLRGLKAGAGGTQAAGQHKRLAGLGKQVTKQGKAGLDVADRQAKDGELVPALTTYRQAARLAGYDGLKKRGDKAIAELSKLKGYADALVEVKKLEPEDARPIRPPGRPPGRVTTLAIGEEGARATTLAIGEEGGRGAKAPGPPKGSVTTQALGEEG